MLVDGEVCREEHNFSAGVNKMRAKQSLDTVSLQDGHSRSQASGPITVAAAVAASASNPLLHFRCQLELSFHQLKRSRDKRSQGTY